MLFSSFPTIDLNEFLLREVDEKLDAEAYFEYMNKQEMLPHLSKNIAPISVQEALSELEYWKSLFGRRRSIYWAISTKEDNKMIGTIGFNTISFTHKRGDISYDLSPAYWGKGIMLKSMKNILKFSDEVIGLARIQATTIRENIRSINLLERCGFSKEGILRQYEIVQDKRTDFYMFARVIT